MFGLLAKSYNVPYDKSIPPLLVQIEVVVLAFVASKQIGLWVWPCGLGCAPFEASPRAEDLCSNAHFLDCHSSLSLCFLLFRMPCPLKIKAEKRPKISK